MFWKKDEAQPQPQDASKGDLAQQRLSQGWIKIATFIELMAVNRETADSMLKEHAKKLKFEPGVMVLEERWGEIKPVEKPPHGVKEAFSNFVEMRILIKDYPMMMYFIMNYLPSALEILEPDKITLNKGDGQNIANAVASLMHQYAAAGIGGVVILKTDKSGTETVS